MIWKHNIGGKRRCLIGRRLLTKIKTPKNRKFLWLRISAKISYQLTQFFVHVIFCKVEGRFP